MLEEPSHSSTGINSSYCLSILLYCAAVRYELDGLVSLAKEKITQWGEHVAILDVLSVSREHAFPNLAQEDSWFSEYLQDTIKAAAKTSPGLFLDPAFSDQIEGDRKFRHIVVKAMLASQPNETIPPQEQNSVERPEDTQLENANEDRIEPLRSENSLLVSPPSLPEVEVEMPYGEMPPQPEPVEPEPEVVVAEAPENLDDGWGFNFSTAKKTKKNKKPRREPEPVPAPPEPEPEAIVEEAPVNFDDDWGAPIGKKSTKKSKKGKKEPVIELEPPPELVAAEPEPDLMEAATPVIVDDMWGSSIKKKSKKKKQSYPEPQLREE